jgi:hypothetical protein
MLFFSEVLDGGVMKCTEDAGLVFIFDGEANGWGYIFGEWL